MYTVEFPPFTATTYWESTNCGGSGDLIFCFAQVKMLLSYSQQQISLFQSLLNGEKLRDDVSSTLLFNFAK